MDLRDWILGLNEDYDVIVDLHDLSWPPEMREYIQHDVLGNGLRGYVTKDGHEAFPGRMNRERFRPFASVVISSGLYPKPRTLLEQRFTRNFPNVQVIGDTKPHFVDYTGKVDVGIEFMPYRVRRFRPLRFYTYPVKTGVDVVLSLLGELAQSLS